MWSNYVTAQRIFNRFCHNQIIVSWHLHLRILAESFIKFVKKNEKYIEKQIYHFFSWTLCTFGVVAWRDFCYATEVSCDISLDIVVFLGVETRYDLYMRCSGHGITTPCWGYRKHWRYGIFISLVNQPHIFLGYFVVPIAAVSTSMAELELFYHVYIAQRIHTTWRRQHWT